MKFFIDTANVEDIKKANDMGVICGVTTNPSLIDLLDLYSYRSPLFYYVKYIIINGFFQ